MSKYIKVYRVVENTNSNDFNNEMPYTIITYELDEKNNKMRVSGYAQWVDAKDFYYYRGLAEQDLVRLCSNQLQQENEELKKELADWKDETMIVEYEKQLAEKDKEITSYKEVLETYKKKPVNIYQVEIRNLQVDKAELKLEIEKLKDKLKRTEKAMHEEVMEHLEYYNADQKQLRHEICEEIRTAVDLGNVFNDGTIKIGENDFDDILKRIEGERK